VIRPAGDGLAAPRSGRNSVENLEAKRICPARKPRSGGEIVFAGRLRPWSPRRSCALARIHNKPRTHGPPVPNGDMADSASPREGCTGLRPGAGKASTATTGENTPSRSLRRRAWGVAWKFHERGRDACRWTVLRDVQAANCQRRGRHALAQPAAASRGV